VEIDGYRNHPHEPSGSDVLYRRNSGGCCRGRHSSTAHVVVPSTPAKASTGLVTLSLPSRIRVGAGHARAAMSRLSPHQEEIVATAAPQGPCGFVDCSEAEKTANTPAQLAVATDQPSYLCLLRTVDFFVVLAGFFSFLPPISSKPT
jgi:hypothetical protein